MGLFVVGYAALMGEVVSVNACMVHMAHTIKHYAPDALRTPPLFPGFSPFTKKSMPTLKSHMMMTA